MLQVAFAGTFPASLEQPVRRHLTTPCEIVVADETDILPRLRHIDVLVTMALTAEMGRAATRLKLVQVPGAGLDRIDRSALPPGAMLANAFGHETGIAEYVIGAILTLTREFTRLDAALRRGDWQSQWAVGTAPPPAWPELAGKTIGILGYERIGQSNRTPRPCLRDGGLRDPPRCRAIGRGRSDLDRWSGHHRSTVAAQ
jgi:phosphoglycerate dehydrogenase-like enzyme